MTSQRSHHRLWNIEPPPHVDCPPDTYLTFDGERSTCKPLTERGVRRRTTYISMVAGIVLILFSIGMLCYIVFAMPHP